MENKSSNIELLFGLETYCEFLKNEKDREFIHDIINVLKADNVEESLFDYCLKRIDKDELLRSIKSYSKSNDIQPIKDGLSRSHHYSYHSSDDYSSSLEYAVLAGNKGSDLRLFVLSSIVKSG